MKNNKQVVFASDCHLEKIGALDKDFTKKMMSKNGMAVINITDSGIDIMESGLKNLA
jgi:hypothetical protein